jgi:hypothetical protein
MTTETNNDNKEKNDNDKETDDNDKDIGDDDKETDDDNKEMDDDKERKRRQVKEKTENNKGIKGYVANMEERRKWGIKYRG